jgi:hypothetical protein
MKDLPIKLSSGTRYLRDLIILRVPFLQLRIELLFVCFSFVLHSKLLVVETFCFLSTLFVSHDQQYNVARERNSLSLDFNIITLEVGLEYVVFSADA